MTRKDVLDRADFCVNGQRQEDYGSPEDNFETIANLWNTYFAAVHKKNVLLPASRVFTAKDVAMMMALLKIARVASGTGSDDCYVDLAGYAACAGEIASKAIAIADGLGE